MSSLASPVLAGGATDVTARLVAQKLTESAGTTDATIFEHLGDVYFQLGETAKAKRAWESAEKAASKNQPPDKRLPEIRKKLEALKKLGAVPRPATDHTP